MQKMSDLVQFFRLFTKSVAKDATAMTDQCTFQAFGHFTIDRFEVNLFIEIVLKSIFPTKPLVVLWYPQAQPGRALRIKIEEVQK